MKWSEVKSLSRVWLFATPWTVAYQAPPSMWFSRQECWSGLPFPSPGDLPDPGIKLGSPALQADALSSKLPGKPSKLWSLANYQGSCRKPRLRVSHSEVQVAHWHWNGTEPLNWWDLMPIPGRWCQSWTELLDSRLESGGLESWLQVLVSTTQVTDTNTQRQRPEFCVAIGKNFYLAPEVSE